MKRRSFLELSTKSALSLPFLPGLAKGFSAEAPLQVHIFSKHLHFLDYENMARVAREIGFAGVDLTVRPGGHVEPARVVQDLPRAVEAMHKHGLTPNMMVTALADAADPLTRQVLETAKKFGFQRYRTNWLAYTDVEPVLVSLEKFRSQLQALARLNTEIGLMGMYQNHYGSYFGSAIWDLYDVLKSIPSGFGSQYDVRHGTVEAAASWYNNLRLIAPHIQSIAVKDFVWAKGDAGWQVESVPLGEGIVDFKRYFRFLKEANIRVPVSLHLEYSLGGADKGNRELTVSQEVVFQAMKRDLDRVQELWREA